MLRDRMTLVLKYEDLQRVMPEVVLKMRNVLRNEEQSREHVVTL